MKTALKILGFTLLALVLATAGLAAGVWFGWFAVPGPVIQAAAAARGLPPAQAKTLEKAARVYQRLRASPAGGFVDRAAALAPTNRDPRVWTALAVEAWPRLDPATLEAVRAELGTPKEQWDQVVGLVSREVAEAAEGRKPGLSAAEAELLNRFAADSGVLDLAKALLGK